MSTHLDQDLSAFLQLTESRVLDPRRLDAVAATGLLDDVCAQTLSRTQTAADRLELSTSLQHTLLSLPPHIDGIEVAVRYVPAGSSLGFGGDWYDVVRIDDDRTAFVVGDVVGHDAVTAAQMAHVRTIVSALVQLDTPLEELFSRAEQLLSNHNESIFATVSVTIVDRAAQRVAMLCAGHPPPILAGADGSISDSRHSRRTWIGTPCAPQIVEWVPYQVGTTLLAYTDGLIEVRGSTIDADIADLNERFGRLHGGPVEDIADALLPGVTEPSIVNDDIAVIVARF